MHRRHPASKGLRSMRMKPPTQPPRPLSGRDAERWPAGDFTVQSTGGEGLPAWTKEDRGVENEDVVLWHSFGLLHVPRVEDFPVMPCESTGFTLKPDGFFAGNPTIDLAPSAPGDGKSKCCSHVG